MLLQAQIVQAHEVYQLNCWRDKIACSLKSSLHCSSDVKNRTYKRNNSFLCQIDFYAAGSKCIDAVPWKPEQILRDVLSTESSFVILPFAAAEYDRDMLGRSWWINGRNWSWRSLLKGSRKGSLSGRQCYCRDSNHVPAGLGQQLWCFIIGWKMQQGMNTTILL